MGSNEVMSGGMNSSPICFPKELGSMILILLFPPLFVFMKELKGKPPFNNFGRIIINFILTSMLYFPGLIHAMSILRTDGPL